MYKASLFKTQQAFVSWPQEVSKPLQELLLDLLRHKLELQAAAWASFYWNLNSKYKADGKKKMEMTQTAVII